MAYQPPNQLLEVLQNIEYEEALADGDPRYVDSQEARGSEQTFTRLARKFGWDPASNAFFRPLKNTSCSLAISALAKPRNCAAMPGI
jgi:hypothetical protein